MRRLPPVHQATLRALVEHLARVVSRSEKNKMDAKNLAIVFGGMIFGDDELPKGGDLLSVQTTKVCASILPCTAADQTVFQGFVVRGSDHERARTLRRTWKPIPALTSFTTNSGGRSCTRSFLWLKDY